MLSSSNSLAHQPDRHAAPSCASRGPRAWRRGEPPPEEVMLTIVGHTQGLSLAVSRSAVLAIEMAGSRQLWQRWSHLEIQGARASHLPFPNAVFDSVVALDHSWHEPDRWCAQIEDIHRVLKPGGRLVAVISISTQPQEPASRDADEVGFWCQENHLKACCRRAGFEGVRTRRIRAVKPWWRGLTRRATRLQQAGKLGSGQAALEGSQHVGDRWEPGRYGLAWDLPVGRPVAVGLLAVKAQASGPCA